MDRKEMNKLLRANEEQLDRSAQEYENDAWDSSNLGKVIMGRPSIANEEVRAITVRLPVSQITALDKKAQVLGGTRSSAVRTAVGRWLVEAGS